MGEFGIMQLCRLLVAALFVGACPGTAAVDANELSKLGACNYCKYCSFCSECKTCPCDPKTKDPLCIYCGYCKYCSLCKACDYACTKGGILDTMMTKVVGALDSVGLMKHDTADALMKDVPAMDQIDKDVAKHRGSSAVPKGTEL